MSEKSQKEILLFLLDETWALVDSSIKGLTSEEFYWKPAPGAFEPEAAFQEMVPGVSSIGFKLAHLAINEILVVDTFTGNGKLTIHEIAKQAPKQFAGWMEFVRETHAAFRRCLLEMPNEALGSKKMIWGINSQPGRFGSGSSITTDGMPGKSRHCGFYTNTR